MLLQQTKMLEEAYKALLLLGPNVTETQQSQSLLIKGCELLIRGSLLNEGIFDNEVVLLCPSFYILC